MYNTNTPNGKAARLALTGDIHSGKSTLAHYLEDAYNFHIINFTDILKRQAVQALCAAGLPVTLEDILRGKHRYRRFLQELGELIGFDTDPRYVLEACGPWISGGALGSVVFDNVRTPEQWAVLKGLGFTLVEIRVEKGVQHARAANLGVTGAALEQMLQHPIEGMLRGYGEIVLDGSWSLTDVTCFLMKELKRDAEWRCRETPNSAGTTLRD